MSREATTVETLKMKRCIGTVGSGGELEPHMAVASSANFGKHIGMKDGLQLNCRTCKKDINAMRRAYVLVPSLWRPATVEQFKAKMGDLDASGCREWLAAHTHGYAVFQTVRSTRIVLSLRYGDGAIEGKQAAHLCQNSSCVEITHLAAMDISSHQAMDNAYRNGEVSIDELIDGAWLQF